MSQDSMFTTAVEPHRMSVAKLLDRDSFDSDNLEGGIVRPC
jgi:hypothetical protein